MNTIDFNNRKYMLLEEIMRIDSDTLLEKIEKVIAKDKRTQKSPLAYTIDELKHEIAAAENESDSYSHEDVNAMSWKK
ncbi:MAG TPA: hypothetical protein VFG54_15895 [Prolixibacteraceae bacterium]|nr:hypothetical protein [Prolixibacteraceae bacterium]